MRDGFGEALAELGRRNSEVVVLSTDAAESTRVQKFAHQHPERFIQCGAAEQNMLGIAAGLALEGKVPFVTGFAAVNPGKNWDQLRTDVCFNNLNVKIVGSNAGLSNGPEGAVHHALEDIAIVRSLPNITVLVPADDIEARKATIAAGTMKGPVYLRLGREKLPPVTKEKTPFTVGRMEIIRAGKDCTIIAAGAMVNEAEAAAERLAKQEIECTVLNCHTIKPIDKHAIITSAKLTGCVVTIEEHQRQGGLGSAVAEVLSEHMPVPLRIIGIKDQFATSGTVKELFEKYGLTPKHIMKEVKQAVLKKCATICTEIPEEHGRRLYAELKPEMHFRLKGGGTVKSIPGLNQALLEMDHETFSHHCNIDKNDFSAWIKDVFDEPVLAKNIERVKTPIGMAVRISRWFQ